MSKNTPIRIAGAGPSGLCAAIALAKAGRQVEVHERYEVVGKRFQGDLQGLENWSLKDNVLNQLETFGLETSFSKTPFYEVSLTDGNTFFTRKSLEPLFYLVKRGPFSDTLDTHLCQQALKAGVDIRYASNLPHEAADIIATGPIRRAVIAVDKGITFPTNLPNMAIGIFHNDLAYLGYSYLLVADGYGCLCSVVFKDFSKLNKCFEKTLELAKRMYPLNLDKAHPVGGIGSFRLSFPKEVGSTLNVGEAAGLQDLLWGFGIRTALTSGYLAAQSILKSESYPNSLDKALTPYLKASMVNRYLWEKFSLPSRSLLPYLFYLPIPARTNFRWLYNFTPFHRLLYPLAARYVEKHYDHKNDSEID
jgi:flavin-dependent dehydrogenase